MTKAEVVKSVSAKTGLTNKDSEKAVNAVIETISGALNTGGEVRLVGFATFKVAHRKARIGRNPATGAQVNIPAKVVKVCRMAK